MSELSNYSIETDHTVMLAFKDGRRVRVPIGQLAHHLAPPDLEKVSAAIRLRRDFIRRHMPKAALVLVVGGLLALLTVGGEAVAHMFYPPDAPPAAPEHSGIVRSKAIETPVDSPKASPVVKGTSTVATAPKRRVQPIRHTNKKPLTLPVANALPVALPSPLPSVTPQVSPQPDVDNQNIPTPAPTPSPTPQIPGQGEVLGDSTGPTSTGPIPPTL